MKECEINRLRDIQAYIDFCLKNDLPYYGVIATITHDCHGLLQDEADFSPRTKGYAELMLDL